MVDKKNKIRERRKKDAGKGIASLVEAAALPHILASKDWKRANPRRWATLGQGRAEEGSGTVIT
jgi:hypothetical protein